MFKHLCYISAENRFASLPNKTALHFVQGFVARRGFEPRQTESKSVVLPLYYRAKHNKPKRLKMAKIRYFRKDFQGK